MPQEGNPFIEQAGVEYFVGREELLKQFKNDLKGLKARLPNHQYVAGLQGTGKTTYLSKLVEIAKAESLLTAMPSLDQQAPSRAHISKIMREIVKELQEKLKVNYLDDWDSGSKSKYFSHPRSEELDSDRLRQDFQTIERLMKEADINGTVVCIDEGQRIDGRALSALKNSLQPLKSFLIVLSIRLATDARGPVAEGRRWLEAKVGAEAEGDIGASRFYVTGIPIGPFETDDEAALCVKRRLTDNTIQFDEQVISRIGRISRRLPNDIILISNNLYNHALKCETQLVTAELLNQTFRNMYRNQVEAAMSLLTNATFTMKEGFKGLLLLRQAATAKEIAVRMRPEADSDLQATIAEAIQMNLDRVSSAFPLSSTTFLRKVENRFEVPDPVYAYAFELTLGLV